mmetsp:Transcript_9494/g.21076  ORF Transcript_9494/g.21076 Transcript_9494/m.21076 type:complete len:202 (+) Transcript_9494:538-1143(+)
MQPSPRVGMTTLSKESGQRSFSLFETTHSTISSSSSFSFCCCPSSPSGAGLSPAILFEATFFPSSMQIRSLAASSAQMGISVAICFAVRVCVRDRDRAKPQRFSSSMWILIVFSPGFSPAEMSFGTSRRTWPSSGSLITRISFPLASNVSLVGHTWAQLSLSMRHMRMKTAWSSFLQDRRSGRSRAKLMVGRATIWHSSMP